MHTDLSNVSKSPTSQKRGHKGITRHGRNMISSAAVILERNYGRHLLSFATLTLPAAESHQLRAIAENWSAVLKQFAKNLSRSLLRQGLPVTLFGVTEIQMKRFARHGDPALHFHFVYVGRNSRKSAWLVDCKEVRRIWIQCIKQYFSSETRFDSTENVQGIKKSVAGYLGKYMSKGISQIQEVIDAGFEDWLPSAWWLMNFDLRREVKNNIVSGKEVGSFLNWLCHNVMAGWIRWFAPVMIKRSDGTEYSVGFGGSFTAQGMAEVKKIFGSARINTVNGID